MKPLLKQTGLACFKPPLCSCSGASYKIEVGIYKNKCGTVENSTTLFFNGDRLEHKGDTLFENIL